MEFFKKGVYGFLGMALFLSFVMCINVAYEYGQMVACNQYSKCSAPAGIAFLLSVPYLLIIMICLFVAMRLRRKVKGFSC